RPETREAEASYSLSAVSCLLTPDSATPVQIHLDAPEILGAGLAEGAAQVARDDALRVGVPVVAVEQPDTRPAVDECREMANISRGHLRLQDAALEHVGGHAMLLCRRTDAPVIVIERNLHPAGVEQQHIAWP